MTNILTYPDLSRYSRPTQRHIDWLRLNGVPDEALRGPPMVLLAHGAKAGDGLFDGVDGGEPWLVFPLHDDAVYWQPRSGELATWNGRAFGLGQDLIGAASTYAFGGCIHIFKDPLAWLRAGRRGLVIVNWNLTYDLLRDVPRVAVAESLLPTYRKHMQPARMPELFVLREREEAAA